MSKYLSIALTTFMAAAACASTAVAHPFHVSIAEMEFNAPRRRLEVALRVHPLDLEKALMRREGERVDLDRTADIDRHLAAYVQEVFLVKTSAGAPCRVTWVGKEVTLKDAWLYFEVPLPADARQFTLSNRTFFELQEDQSNTMTLRLGAQRRTLRCTRAAPRVTFEIP